MVRGSRPPESSRFARCVRAFEEEFDYLHALLRRQGLSRADAEDALQEVFTVMWRRWEEYQPDRPLRPWLAGIAIRRAYKHLGRHQREVTAATPEDPARPADSSLDDRMDARALLRRALAEVPETNRSALMLHDLDGMPIQEVARALSIPVATAYTRVGRARKAFVQAARKLQASRRGNLRVVIAPEALLALGDQRWSARAAPTLPDSAPPADAPLRGTRAARGPAAWLAVAATVFVAVLVVPRLSASVDRIEARSAPAPVRVPPLEASTVRPLRASSPKTREWSRVPALRVAPGPVGPLELGQGLAGYWRFDEGRGSLLSRDLTTGRHDCLLRGLDPGKVWLAGALGGGVDVQKGWIECAQPEATVTLSTALSVVAWVRAAEAQAGHMALVARQLGQDKDDFFFLGLQDGKLKVFGSLWGLPAVAGRPLPLGRWVHIAFTHAPDGTTSLYQDGVQVAVAQKKGPSRRTARAAPRLTIGTGINGPGEGQRVQQFSGAIDEVAVYDRALEADQIASLAAGAQPPAAP